MDSSEQQHRSQQESEGTEQAAPSPSPTAGEPTAEQEEQVGEDYRYPPEVTDVPMYTVLI